VKAAAVDGGKGLDMAALEGLLAKQLFVGGDLPTDSDTDSFDRMKMENIRADNNPNVFGWFSLVAEFNPTIRESWKPAAPAKGGKGK